MRKWVLLVGLSALLPYRTGSHWYALRDRHVVFDRFLLAVSSRMTAIQPCRVEDVASDFGQRGDFGRIGTFPSGAVAAGSGSAADDAEGSTRDHLSQRDEQLDHQGVEQSDDLLDMGQEYESPDEEPLSWNLQLLLQYLADTDRDSPSVAEEQDFRDVAGEPDPDTDHVMVMLDFLTRHYLTRLWLVRG